MLEYVRVLSFYAISSNTPKPIGKDVHIAKAEEPPCAYLIP